MSINAATLLVTGGTGFVMSNLVRHWLESDPSAQAVVLDSNPPDAVAERFFAGFQSRLTVLQADLRDPAAFDAVSSGAAITHVVHGAAVTSVNHMTLEEDGTSGLAGALPALEANFMGTARVLAWAGRLPALERFVYASTGSVYGESGPAVPGQPLPEEGYVDPDGLYGLTKFASEMLVAQCVRQFGMPAVAVRFSSVFGPMDRETPSRAVALPPRVVLEKALAGEPVRISDPDGVGDFIYAPDLADAICRLLLSKAAPRHPVYNIAYGQATRAAELVDLVAELLPGSRYEVVPAEQADLSLSASQSGGRWGAYDISRLKQEFDWQPRPLRAALADYLAWLRGEAQSEGEGIE